MNMKITPRNIVKHELIGLEVEVKASPDTSQIGIHGKILDETKNTLTLETGKGRKTIEKKYRLLRFKLPDGRYVLLRGDKISYRPEERVKKCR